MDLYQTAGADLGALWPRIEPLLYQACERSRGDITPDTFRQAVETGDAQLWVIADMQRPEHSRIRAIIGTRLAYVMSGRKVCSIILCAGHGRKEWLHLLDRLADWARREGCAKFSILARRGWVRDLSQFTLTSVELEMELDNGRKDRDNDT